MKGRTMDMTPDLPANATELADALLVWTPASSPI